MSDKADFYVLYRWRLHAGMEQQFIDAWAETPRKEHWVESMDLGSPDAELARLMHEAIEKRQSPEELLPVKDANADNQ